VTYKGISLLILIASSSSWAASQKCSTLYRQLSPLPGEGFVKIIIEKEGVKLSRFRKCLGPKYSQMQIEYKSQPNSSDEIILKKGQVLKIPVKANKRPPIPWQAFNHFGLGNFTSTTSRETRYFYNDVRAAYTLPIEDKFSLVSSLGFKFMQADLTSKNGKNENDFGLTGSLSMYFLLKKAYTPYAFFKLDRYVVSGVDEESSSFSFLFSRSVGTGIKWDIADRYTFYTDLGMIGATKSKVNNLKSGYLLGLELDYQWSELSAGYRLEKFEIKTNEYTDRGLQHVIKIGYQF
jgi:hypothetical protein